MDFLKIHDEEDLRSLPSGVWGIKEPSFEYHGSGRESGTPLDQFPDTDYRQYKPFFLFSFGILKRPSRSDPPPR